VPAEAAEDGGAENADGKAAGDKYDAAAGYADERFYCIALAPIEYGKAFL